MVAFGPKDNLEIVLCVFTIEQGSLDVLTKTFGIAKMVRFRHYWKVSQCS
jgi:hypothetical protein